MENQQSQQPVFISSGNNNLVGGLMAIAVLATGSYLLYKKVLDKKAAAEGEKIGTEAEASSASEIMQASNQSGISWLKSIDGTNAVQIMNATKDAIKAGKTYKQISESYKKLTKGGNMQDDMQAELTAAQYKTFLNVIKLNTATDNANTSNFANPVKPGDILVSKGKLIVRKTPYINGTPRTIDRRGNAIDFIENTGTFIGMSTGKYKTTTSRDTILAEKASVATVFYEVVVFAKNNTSHNVWVAANLIKVFPKGSVLPSAFAKQFWLDLTNYQKAEAVNAPFLEGFEGLTGVATQLI